MANQKKSTSKASANNRKKSTSTKSSSAKKSSNRTTKTTSNSSNAKSSKSVAAKKVTSNTSSTYTTLAPKSSNSEASSALYDFLMKFRRSPFYAPFAFGIVSLLLISFDLLIAWNNFERFFKILGFEIIVIGLFFLLRRTLITFNSSNRR